LRESIDPRISFKEPLLRDQLEQVKAQLLDVTGKYMGHTRLKNE